MTTVETLEFLINSQVLSKYQLCKKANISQSTLSNLIKRSTDPTLYVLDKICQAMDITMVDFFYIRDDVSASVLMELVTRYMKLTKNQRLFLLNIMDLLNEKIQ